MAFKDFNSSASNEKNQKSVSFRRRALYIGVAVLILIVAVFAIIQLFKQPSVMEYHVSSPNAQLNTVTQEPVISQEHSPTASSTQNNSYAPKSSPTPASPSKQPEIQTQSPNPSPSQPAEKASGFGISVGGLSFLNQENLNQYFDSLKSLGVQWVRWDVDWSVIQKDGPTRYNWDGTDRVAATAKRYGINSLVIITYAPRWATDQSCGSNQRCAPIDSKEFGRFAGEVALRYKDSIKFWEIWNEPNLPFFWGPKPDVKKYADVLEEAYTEIKKANPSAIVLSGGLSDVGNKSDGSISPLTFMSSLYALGANQYFDAVALHPYTYPASPNHIDDWNGWQQMYSVRQLIVKQGDGEKKIWVTEYGVPTGGPGVARDINYLNFNYGLDYMTESAQQEIAQEAITLYNKNTDWLGPFFWYTLRDNSDKQDTPENFFGLIRYDGSKKPAYDVFKNAILSAN